jgi:hypothetical protein
MFNEELLYLKGRRWGGGLLDKVIPSVLKIKRLI